jgi:AcrR family transcriptional regulator
MNPVVKPTKKEIVTEFRTREILAAARRLMQDRGVEAVTVEEIAAAAGVAKGTVYLYFQGKDELIQALMSQVGENLIQDLETLLAKPGSPGEKLNVLVTGLMKFVGEERFLFPFYVRDVIRGAASERQGPGSHPREVEAKFMALLDRFFAEGIQVREFIPADPRLLSYLLRGLVRAVGYYQMTQSQKDAVGEALPVVKALLSSGLLARPRSEVDDVVET